MFTFGDALRNTLRHYLDKTQNRVAVRIVGDRFGGDELGVQGTCQTRDDFVLHVEKVGERLNEPLRPEMVARSGVDELHVDARDAQNRRRPPTRWTSIFRAWLGPIEV
jgi:hypothetical protein